MFYVITKVNNEHQYIDKIITSILQFNANACQVLNQFRLNINLFDD